jgi:hypothetical protein
MATIDIKLVQAAPPSVNLTVRSGDAEHQLILGQNTAIAIPRNESTASIQLLTDLASLPCTYEDHQLALLSGGTLVSLAMPSSGPATLICHSPQGDYKAVFQRSPKDKNQVRVPISVRIEDHGSAWQVFALPSQNSSKAHLEYSVDVPFKVQRGLLQVETTNVAQLSQDNGLTFGPLVEFAVHWSASQLTYSMLLAFPDAQYISTVDIVLAWLDPGAEGCFALDVLGVNEASPSCVNDTTTLVVPYGESRLAINLVSLTSFTEIRLFIEDELDGVLDGTQTLLLKGEAQTLSVELPDRIVTRSEYNLARLVVAAYAEDGSLGRVATRLLTVAEPQSNLDEGMIRVIFSKEVVSHTTVVTFQKETDLLELEMLSSVAAIRLEFLVSQTTVWSASSGLATHAGGVLDSFQSVVLDDSLEVIVKLTAQAGNSRTLRLMLIGVPASEAIPSVSISGGLLNALESQLILPCRSAEIDIEVVPLAPLEGVAWRINDSEELTLLPSGNSTIRLQQTLKVPASLEIVRFAAGTSNLTQLVLLKPETLLLSDLFGSIVVYCLGLPAQYAINLADVPPFAVSVPASCMRLSGELSRSSIAAPLQIQAGGVTFVVEPTRTTFEIELSPGDMFIRISVIHTCGNIDASIQLTRQAPSGHPTPIAINVRTNGAIASYTDAVVEVAVPDHDAIVEVMVESSHELQILVEEEYVMPSNIVAKDDLSLGWSELEDEGLWQFDVQPSCRYSSMSSYDGMRQCVSASPAQLGSWGLGSSAWSIYETISLQSQLDIYSPTTTSPLLTYDGTDPEASHAVVDCSFSPGQNTIHCTWDGFHDPDTSVVRYGCMLGTSPGADDVESFVDVGQLRYVQFNAPSRPMVQVFATILATNGAGHSTASSTSAIVLSSIKPTPPSTLRLESAVMLPANQPATIFDFGAQYQQGDVVSFESTLFEATVDIAPEEGSPFSNTFWREVDRLRCHFVSQALILSWSNDSSPGAAASVSLGVLPGDDAWVSQHPVVLRDGFVELHYTLPTGVDVYATLELWISNDQTVQTHTTTSLRIVSSSPEFKLSDGNGLDDVDVWVDTDSLHTTWSLNDVCEAQEVSIALFRSVVGLLHHATVLRMFRDDGLTIAPLERVWSGALPGNPLQSYTFGSLEYQDDSGAAISGLQSGRRYFVKLVVVDGFGTVHTAHSDGKRIYYRTLVRYLITLYARLSVL